jgi:hypothetical protein
MIVSGAKMPKIFAQHREPNFKALEKSTAELVAACQRGIDACRQIRGYEISPIPGTKALTSGTKTVKRKVKA